MQAMRIPTLLLVATALSVTACNKNEKKEAPAAAKAPDPGKAAPAADAAPAAEAMANKAGWCPSTVAGATTAIDKDASKDGTVVVTVTAADEAATATIRARTRHLVDVQKAPGATIQHTGEGTGGGDAGVCPVIARQNTLASEDVAGGVKITMTPASADQGTGLLAEVEKRIGEAKAWTETNIKQEGAYGEKGGDGGQKGGHGGNRSGKGDASGDRTGGDKQGPGDGAGPGDGSGPGEQKGTGKGAGTAAPAK
jgi:hypothetical protein